MQMAVWAKENGGGSGLLISLRSPSVMLPVLVPDVGVPAVRRAPREGLLFLVEGSRAARPRMVFGDELPLLFSFTELELLKRRELRRTLLRPPGGKPAGAGGGGVCSKLLLLDWLKICILGVFSA